MPHVDVAGRPLHVLRRGTGAPLLLIQGLSGSHRSWGEPFLDALEPGLELIAYDHRGIGTSGPIDGPFSIADLARDAAGLLDALGIERAHVVGISMGGMVAQELALARPERVETLTLGCTYAGGPGSRLTAQPVIERLIAAFGSGDPELALRAGWEVNVSEEFARRPGAFEAFREMALAVPAPLPVLFEQLRATASHDASARLGGLAMPVLVVHGDQDLMLDVANARQIAALVPGARLEILEGVGHLFWWERPAASARLIREHALAAAVQPGSND